MIYHVKGDPTPETEAYQIPEEEQLTGDQREFRELAQKWLRRAKAFPCNLIQPIAFLSKKLTETERRYGPTELEMATLVWSIRKTRHLIESAPGKAYVFTDHSAIVALARQTHLTTTVSTDRLNLRLTSAAAYLNQFEIELLYKPGRIHIVPDALSRLERNAELENLKSDVLDEL